MVETFRPLLLAGLSELLEGCRGLIQVAARPGPPTQPMDLID